MRQKTNKVYRSYYLPEDYMTELKGLSEDLQVTQSTLVILAIGEFLKKTRGTEENEIESNE